MPYILVLPFVLIICFIFLGGVFQALVQSLGYLPVFGMKQITLNFYRQILSDPRFISSLANTFYIAITASLMSIIAGTGVAFIMNRALPGRFFYVLYKTPVILPYLLVIIVVLYTFSQTGIVSRLAFALGLIDDPNSFPLLVYDKFNIGVILVYLFKQIPFVALTVFTVLKNLDKKYVQIAENLGATSRLIVFRVTLPMLAPSILSAFLIIFAFNFGAFETPFLLGNPGRLTLPLLAYHELKSPVLSTRPAGMVINVILSVISYIMIALYTLLYRALTKRGLGEAVL